MTLSEFQDAVIAEAFPQGPPENLLAVLRRYVVNGLIDAQDYIPCFAYRHDDILPACKTYYHCGTTQVVLPRGKVLRLYTVQDRSGTGLEWCEPVIYQPVTISELRRWQAKFKSNWLPQYFTSPTPSAGLPMGFNIPNATSDAPSGRAFGGVYAIEKSAMRLVVAPWLQSYEALVIEWQGIKRSWAVTDTVPDDPDFQRLIAWWVSVEHGRKWGCKDLQVRMDAYWSARRDMMVRCKIETQLHGEPASAEEVDASWSSWSSGPVDVEAIQAAQVERNLALITLVGNAGTGGSDAEEVAAAVQTANPAPDSESDTSGTGWHFSVGDNAYAPTSAADALEPYNEFSVVNRLRLTLGSADLDTDPLGTELFSLVPTPVNVYGNSRWYNQVVGPVEFFVANAGFNTSAEEVEPFGNYDGSTQHLALRTAILRSTAIWKVLVVHGAPFTSGSSQTPGNVDLRWLSDLPVHLVVAGSSANYERGTFRNRPHIIVGTGGVALEGFGAPIEGSDVRLSEFGFLRLRATCTELTADFLDTDGNVEDSIEITDQDPPIKPPAEFGTIYWGRSTKTASFDEADVLAWDSLDQDGRQGTYAFVEDEVTDTYCCFAIPAGMGGPQSGAMATGFKIDALAMAMARPDGTPAFGSWVNGYGAESVNVAGVSCLVYRTYNVLHGSVDIEIT